MTIDHEELRAAISKALTNSARAIRTSRELGTWTPGQMAQFDHDAALIAEGLSALAALPEQAPAEPVAWRVRVISDDQEEWSLLPAGGGTDYLDRKGYECQPLYKAAPQAPAEAREVDEAALRDLWVMGNCRMSFEKFKEGVRAALSQPVAPGEGEAG